MKPRQSVLRRAISNAYYALFHELAAAVGKAMAPAAPPELAPEVARQLDHGRMVKACELWKKSGGSSPPWYAAVSGVSPIPPGLSAVTGAFVSLQQLRHEADYDTRARFAKAATISHIERAEDAIKTWRAVRAKHLEVTNVFLANLLYPSPRK